MNDTRFSYRELPSERRIKRKPMRVVQMYWHFMFAGLRVACARLAFLVQTLV